VANSNNRSTLTQKSQITLPKKVREVLEVGPGDQIGFEIRGKEVKIQPLLSKLDENYGRVGAKRKPENFSKIRQEVQKKIGQQTAEGR
jgi:AbrB family looped-hinge helix DNA binding protein